MADIENVREELLGLLKSPPIKLRNKVNPVGEVNLDKLADQILSLIAPLIQEERERIKRNIQLIGTYWLRHDNVEGFSMTKEEFNQAFTGE